MINHSCDPNAFALFEGRKLHVRSLKKIAAGEEITISYLDPTLDMSTRKNLLKRNWFFECHCTSSHVLPIFAVSNASHDRQPL
jgi:SET and MYND domain-containing protein